MEKNLVKMEKMEKMEKILAILEKILVTIRQDEDAKMVLSLKRKLVIDNSSLWFSLSPGKSQQAFKLELTLGFCFV